MASRFLSRRESYAPEFPEFRRGFDDFFTRMFSPFWDRSWMGPSSELSEFIPAADAFIDQNKFHVQMALPGVRPEDVNLQVHGNELRVTGERKQEITPSEDRTYRREIIYGSFERTFTLPEGIQADKVEANFQNGVLDITAPLSEKAMPRKIEIKGETPSGKKLAA